MTLLRKIKVFLHLYFHFWMNIYYPTQCSRSALLKWHCRWKSKYSSIHIFPFDWAYITPHSIAGLPFWNDSAKEIQSFLHPYFPFWISIYYPPQCSRSAILKWHCRGKSKYSSIYIFLFEWTYIILHSIAGLPFWNDIAEENKSIPPSIFLYEHILSYTV